MSRRNNVMVSKRDHGWAVKTDGASRAAGLYDTQKEAIERGRQIAMNNQSELSIQGADGKIRDKHSYGRDPYPPRG